MSKKKKRKNKSEDCPKDLKDNTERMVKIANKMYNLENNINKLEKSIQKLHNDVYILALETQKRLDKLK